MLSRGILLCGIYHSIEEKWESSSFFLFDLIEPFPLKLNARAFDGSAEQSDQDGAPTTFPSSRGKVNL